MTSSVMEVVEWAMVPAFFATAKVGDGHHAVPRWRPFDGTTQC
jgi:hypothetical protein